MAQILVLLGNLAITACGGAEEEHPSAYQYNATPVPRDAATNLCATPNQGCPCATRGQILDCGSVHVIVDGYESCFEGSRICTESGTWSACASDQSVAQSIR